MEYAYATCILNESGEEINEKNLTAVLEAAGCAVQESRVKAIVAALEDVEVDTAVDFEDVGTGRQRNGSSAAREPSEPTEGPDATEVGGMDLIPTESTDGFDPEADASNGDFDPDSEGLDGSVDSNPDGPANASVDEFPETDAGGESGEADAATGTESDEV